MNITTGKKNDGLRDLQLIDKHYYIGKTDNMMEIAQGKPYATALNWHYSMKLTRRGNTVRVRFND